MASDSNNNVHRVVRGYLADSDGEVKVGNAVTARYTGAAATATQPTARYWMATFASPGYVMTGYAKESDALHALAEQLRADADALSLIAAKLASGGR